MQEIVTAQVVRPRGRTLRAIYLVLGLAFTGIGIVGAFMPLIPTTGPLLLATFCFGRSSERLHRWLTGHRRFGRFISDFEEGRGIPLRTKIVAVVSMTAAFTYTAVWALPHPVARVLVAAVAVWAIGYVLRLPTAAPAK
jgi:hypothetical protein